jgi:hypothetical protein
MIEVMSRADGQGLAIRMNYGDKVVNTLKTERKDMQAVGTLKLAVSSFGRGGMVANGWLRGCRSLSRRVGARQAVLRDAEFRVGV